MRWQLSGFAPAHPEGGVLSCMAPNEESSRTCHPSTMSLNSPLLIRPWRRPMATQSAEHPCAAQREREDWAGRHESLEPTAPPASRIASTRRRLSTPVGLSQESESKCNDEGITTPSCVCSTIYQLQRTAYRLILFVAAIDAGAH